ncbi:MAG: hypothetical protein KQJ78_07250 [Deltaproteobacteria bacterium]|nr:hypothetical protein [Deltaproteobacteria bacterium]
MSPRSIYVLKLMGLAVLLTLWGCADGTELMNTRAVEENWLNMGEERRTYDYAQDLLAQGRYQEAHAAFLSVESMAYTSYLRSAARQRRLWLERAIAAQERGLEPPPFTGDTITDTPNAPGPAAYPLPPGPEAGGDTSRAEPVRLAAPPPAPAPAAASVATPPPAAPTSGYRPMPPVQESELSEDKPAASGW